MSDALLKVDVETKGLIAALDSLGASVLKHTKAAARVTAERIVAGARARVRRRTGRTAAGITAEETYDGTGYVVLPFNAAFERALIESGNDQQPANLPLWLEFGTKKMTAKPFFFAAARVEVGAHDRRMRAAIQDAIDEKGLGD